jgi:hypothetical protein
MTEELLYRTEPLTEAVLVRYELTDAEGGTRVAIHAVGTPGRFFGWATPVMARQVRRSITADLQRLADLLRSGNVQGPLGQWAARPMLFAGSLPGRKVSAPGCAPSRT